LRILLDEKLEKRKNKDVKTRSVGEKSRHSGTFPVSRERDIEAIGKETSNEERAPLIL
jgi:hypothetical protein